MVGGLKIKEFCNSLETINKQNLNEPASIDKIEKVNSVKDVLALHSCFKITSKKQKSALVQSN